MKILLVNDAHGQYVPQVFAQKTAWHWLSGVKQSNWETLLDGPDNPDYWEAWEDVLNNATLTLQGQKFWLWQGCHGNLWAIKEGESPKD